jgi:hypothetical protein
VASKAVPRSKSSFPENAPRRRGKIVTISVACALVLVATGYWAWSNFAPDFGGTGASAVAKVADHRDAPVAAPQTSAVSPEIAAAYAALDNEIAAALAALDNEIAAAQAALDNAIAAEEKFRRGRIAALAPLEVASVEPQSSDQAVGSGRNAETRAAPAEKSKALASSRRTAAKSSVRSSQLSGSRSPKYTVRAQTQAQLRGTLKAHGSVDEIYNERAAAECERGILGLVCREKVRWSLCEGKWTPDEVPSMTVCHVRN